MCREAFAPTEGGGAVRCGGITGGVEDLEREKEGPNEGGRGRKRRNDKRERKEGWWNGIERRGRRRGWRRAGGEAKSMHRGGMQRAPSNTGPYVRVHSTALYDAPFFSLTLSVTIHAHASALFRFSIESVSTHEIIAYIRDASVDCTLLSMHAFEFESARVFVS